MLLATDFNFSDEMKKYFASVNKLKQHFKSNNISTINTRVYSSKSIPFFLKKQNKISFVRTVNT